MSENTRPIPSNFNPGMGIYQFASLLKDDPAENDIGRECAESVENPYASGTVIYVPWRMMEPEEGAYRWDRMDSLMAPWIAAGKRCILRVCPARREVATPEWVFKAGARHVAQRGMQTHSQDDMGYINKFPVYWDAVFQGKYGNFIKALAARYDDSPHVEAVQMALGKWGESFLGSEVDLGALKNTLAEWHEAGYSETVAIEAFKSIIMLYKKAFVKTSLICMTGGPFVDTLRSAGSCRNTEELSAFCVENGIMLQQNGFSNAYDNYVNCSNIFNRYYRRTKVMYEIASAANANAADIKTLTERLLKEHVSYAFAYTKNLASRESAMMAGLKLLHRRIGYQLKVKDIRIAGTSEGKLEMAMLWENAGIAPVYGGLDCKVSFFNPAGDRVCELTPNTIPDLSLWTERQKIYARLRLNVPAGLGKGEYALKLALKDRKGRCANVSVEGAGQPVQEVDLGKAMI